MSTKSDAAGVNNKKNDKSPGDGIDSREITRRPSRNSTLRSERSSKTNGTTRTHGTARSTGTDRSSKDKESKSIVGHGTIGGNSSSWMGYQAKMRETQKVRDNEGSQKYEDSRSVSSKSTHRRSANSSTNDNKKSSEKDTKKSDKQ